MTGSGNCIRHILYVKYNQKDLRSNPEIFLIYAKMLNDIGCVGGCWKKNLNDSFSGALSVQWYRMKNGKNKTKKMKKIVDI